MNITLRNSILLFIFCIVLLLGSACTSRGDNPSPTGTYAFDLKPADFVERVDNPYFPLLPTTRWVYEGQGEDGLERIEIEALSETRQVMGITATVVHDTVYLDGEMIEGTYDWYAQDKQGNVWYLGEDVSNYENGELVDKAGSWEAGVDEALPGIIMYANPADHIGEVYRQEYYQGEAEDMAELLSASESLTIPLGSFTDVVKTKDYTPLEPDQLENKYYAQGIGVVKEVNVNSGEEALLIEFTPPGE
jgi:hypothetical protein